MTLIRFGGHFYGTIVHTGTTMTQTSRKSFSKEYKAEVVDIVRRNDGNVSKTAVALGVSKSRIYAWLNEAKDGDVLPASGSISAAERVELTKLRREVKHLRMERESLKKTAAWFAAQSK